MTLSELLAALDQYADRVPIEDLLSLLDRTTISLDEVRDHVRFDDHYYQRNLVRRGTAYEALVLCWKNGQRSTIHDHLETSCGVIVIDGIATETLFARNARGWIYPTATEERAAGGVCGSADLDTHQLSALQEDGSDLVTLHIYSPPMRDIGVYDLAKNTVQRVNPSVNE